MVGAFPAADRSAGAVPLRRSFRPTPMRVGTVFEEAAYHGSSASIQLNHLELFEGGKATLGSDDAFRLDLSLTKRLSSRMRFARWEANRFARPGQLFVVPPDEELIVWNDVGRDTVVVCHLSKVLFDEVPERSLNALEDGLNVVDNLIEQTLLRMLDEVRRPGFATDVMIDALALQLSLHLQRHQMRKDDAVDGGLQQWRLRRIDDRLASSNDPPGLTELAGMCGLSIRQLSRGFQRSRGMSIGRYVARARMNQAKALLNGDHSIKAIAGELGFASTASFCVAFRNATGTTPSAFQEIVRAARRGLASAPVIAGRAAGRTKAR